MVCNLFKLKVKIPAPASLRTTKLLEGCTFDTAVSIELCGSYKIGQALSSSATVDVRVVMPKVGVSFTQKLLKLDKKSDRSSLAEV